MFSGPDHPAYPVVELASRTRMLNIGDNPRAPPDAAGQSRTGCVGTIWVSRYLDQLAVCRCAARLRTGGQAAAGLCGRLDQYRSHVYRVGEILRGACQPRKGAGTEPEQCARAVLSGAGGEACRAILTRNWPIFEQSSDAVSASARCRGVNWESPITRRHVMRKRWSSSKRCRQSIRTIWRRTTTWR